MNGVYTREFTTREYQVKLELYRMWVGYAYSRNAVNNIHHAVLVIRNLHVPLSSRNQHHDIYREIKPFKNFPLYGRIAGNF